MIVHPNLENLASDAHAPAEPLDLVVEIFPLQLPAQFLGKCEHLVLLIGRELCAEALLSGVGGGGVLDDGVAVVVDVEGVVGGGGAWGDDVGEFAVEVAVAAAGGAVEVVGRRGGVVEGEFAAAVGGVTAETGCMVSKAFSVMVVRVLSLHYL